MDFSDPVAFKPGLVLAFAPDERGFRVPRARRLLVEILGQEATETGAWRTRLELPVERCFIRRLLPLDGAVHRFDLPPYLSALLMGLCGEGYYAPDSPLILSEARLGRHLQLHSLAGYYA